MQFVIYGLARCIQSWLKPAKKIVNYYKVSQFWGTPIDYMNSAYIEISFSVLMNVRSIEWESGNRGLDMSNYYMIFHAFLLVFYPVWLNIFLTNNYEKLSEDQVSQKYGNAYKGIRQND